jgi:hypothetical protein
VKGGRAVWVGNSSKVFTVGFSKSAERQYAIYDTKNMQKPLLEPQGLKNNFSFSQFDRF